VNDKEQLEKGLEEEEEKNLCTNSNYNIFFKIIAIFSLKSVQNGRILWLQD
jgi:hypothetical protein